MIEIDKSGGEIGADIEQEKDGRSQMTPGLFDARFHVTPTAVSVSVSEKLLFIGPTHFANVRSIARTLATFAVLPWVTTELF